MSDWEKRIYNLLQELQIDPTEPRQCVWPQTLCSENISNYNYNSYVIPFMAICIARLVQHREQESGLIYIVTPSSRCRSVKQNLDQFFMCNHSIDNINHRLSSQSELRWTKVLDKLTVMDNAFRLMKLLEYFGPWPTSQIDCMTRFYRIVSSSPERLRGCNANVFILLGNAVMKDTGFIHNILTPLLECNSDWWLIIFLIEFDYTRGLSAKVLRRTCEGEKVAELCKHTWSIEIIVEAVLNM